MVLEKTLESPLDCKQIQLVHPKGNQSWIFIGRTDAKAETLILWPTDAKNWLIWKDPDAGKDWRQEEKGTTEDEMVGWHSQLDGHEFEQAPGVGDGQGGLVCYNPWGHKESDMTEQLNWTDLLDTFTHFNPILLQIHFEKQPLVWAVWALSVSPIELGTSYIIHMLLHTHSTPTDFSGPLSLSHSSPLFCQVCWPLMRSCRSFISNSTYPKLKPVFFLKPVPFYVFFNLRDCNIPPTEPTETLTIILKNCPSFILHSHY